MVSYMSLTLYKSEFDQGLKQAKAQLSSIGFYDRLKYKSLDNNSLPTIEASVVFHAVERFSSLLFALTKKLKQHTNMIEDDINAYSLYISSKEASLFLSDINHAINPKASRTNYKNNHNLESIVTSKVKTDRLEFLTRSIISDLCDCLRSNNVSKWPYIACDYFLAIADEIVVPKNSISICIFDRCYNGDGVDHDSLKPPKVKVVGNRNVIKKLRTSVNALLRYLPEHRYNPGFDLPIPFALNIYGNPGVGKTLSVHQIAYEALQKANQLGLELHLEFLGNQLKSEYINYGSRMLSRLFDNVCVGDSIWLLVMDEAHRVLFSRTNNVHEEEIKFAERIISFLEGVQYPNYGNYVFILISNYPVTDTNYFDNALASRFLGGIVEAKGPETIDDYKQLFIEHLKNIQMFIKNDFDYDLLAKIAFENNISGRAVNRACKNLAERIELDAPEMVFASKEDALADIKRAVSKSNITTMDVIRALEEVTNYERLFTS